jgi:bifunctional UDP-N-acetylglucosamine pyrophosphorylase/glucosamine-1-phosphate N-acetyltransferase
MLAHAIKSAQATDPDHIVVVAGNGADAVRKATAEYAPDAQVVLQEEQLGTGHAVAQAKAVLGDYDGDILVLYGDTPFISDQTIADIATARANADLVVLGFHAADPGRYGRLVTDGDTLEKIVEYKDASEEERAITLCNSGVMAARAADMFDWIDATGNENASGEYYLTDCTVVEQNVVFAPGVTVESGATIRAFSHLEGCHVARGGIIGPYARLRPGAELSEDVRIGNFVEIKNALIGEGSKVNHLSYVGDAEIGSGSNIGAGTITCNYDGVMKHKTTIGNDVFVGSNTLLVAPVTLGNKSMTATGAVITKDVQAEALAIARVDQVNKPRIAVKLFDILRKRKAKRNSETS